ncbi:MAG: hypothetical protein J5689_00995 [Clostridia bacterium]|nr:hypothetical protein [Clostridia bacterium]
MKVKNGFLIGALVLSVAHFVILMLTLFNVINASSVLPANFNYFVAFALIAVCLALFTIALFVESKKQLIVPTWLAVSFYCCFFIFTNIYYFFGLYNIFLTNLLFYVVLAVLVSILSLSIYYNELKALDGTLENKNRYLGYVLFSISVSISLIFELIVMLIKYISNPNVNLTVHALASFGILILGALIFAVLFTESIKKTKRFANACLIKINTKQQ